MATSHRFSTARSVPRSHVLLLATIAALLGALLPTATTTAQEEGSSPRARSITTACIPGEVPSSEFNDVAGNTHEDAVECISWYQVAQGLRTSRYGTAGAVTRGQMATFIAAVVAHLGVDLPSDPRNAFDDDEGDAHEGSIDQLTALEIIGGYPDGTFRPRRVVPRDQMATFITAALAKAGIEIDRSGQRFSDTDGNAHEGSINAAARLGIAAGTGEDKYSPAPDIRRDQMAAFLARSLDLGVDEGKAFEGGAASTVTPGQANPGDTLDGRIRTHRSIENVSVEGCGLNQTVEPARDGTFALTLPEDQPEGTCTIAVTVATRRGRSMTDTDASFVQVGDAQTQAAVAIIDPTTSNPAVVDEGQPFTITFTTDQAGGYVLAHRLAGTEQYRAFEGAEGSGSAPAGTTTVTVAAPIQDGNHDIALTFVTSEGSQRSDDEQLLSLTVVEPPGEQPADVAITDPTSGSPEITTQGAPVSITFTSDRSGTYAVLYKPAFPPGSGVYVPFPDGEATGTLTEAGEKTVAVTAPALSGSYDLRVEFTTTAGLQSAATQTGALVVTVPGVTQAQRCDPIDPSVCMFPFPNDHFTAADPTSDTGRRINFNILSMPRNGADQDPSGPNEPSNGAGKPIDPTEWNRNDGFSPGNHVMTLVPGLDLHQTWGTTGEAYEGDPNAEPTYFDYRDHIADIDRYLRPDAPIVILNARTGERHPFWSELDQNTSGPGGTPVEPSKALLLRPAINFDEGERYIVALRRMRDADGNLIEPTAAFKAYRDATAPLTDARRVKFESIFSTLATNGIARDDLFLAWDFTVASERNLSERMLHIRDDAFAQLGDTNLADGIVQGDAPEFVVDQVSEGEQGGAPGLGRFRQIDGRVVVPNYLDRPQEAFEIPAINNPPDTDPLPFINPAPPGSRFYYGPGGGQNPLTKDALPQQNPVERTLEAKFRCRVPLDRGTPVMMGLYGHGLLGTRDQIGDIKSPGHYGFGGCALDWIGMATEDAPNVAAILGDVSNFPSLPDRSQQGFLNFLYAGRALVHPDGFATNKAFQDENGTPLIQTATATDTPLYYDGNSQGGILGAGLMAVSVDAKRAILGVPGNNYSTLLNRSVDWEPLYGRVYYSTYQNKLEQQLGFGLLQMLWDRSEGNGYAHHLTTDPLDNTIPHEVMWQVAWADHQVSNHAAEVSARTSGSPVMTPNLERPPGNHHWEKSWAFDGSLFSDTATYPYQGSALVYWDSGNTTPPNGNLPPTHNPIPEQDEDGDPHGHPRNELAATWQEAHFILTGQMADVCAGGPYLTKFHPANNGTASCTPPAAAPGTLP